jgi:protein TonB
MFTGVDQAEPAARIRSATAVLLVHALLGYAFISGLGVEIVRQTSERMELIELVEPPPPPEIEKVLPKVARSEAEEGEASPENLRMQATEVVALPQKIEIPRPPPIVTAPVAGVGAANDSGASDRPGPGTGAGGVGDGSGSGGDGNGTGGGIGSEAQLIRGRIVHADYPRSAVRERIGGTVITRLAIGPDGRVSDCTIRRSSGSADLDHTTCRLIIQRFRFDPARDRDGRPIASVTGWQQRWWLEGD